MLWVLEFLLLFLFRLSLRRRSPSPPLAAVAPRFFCPEPHFRPDARFKTKRTQFILFFFRAQGDRARSVLASWPRQKKLEKAAVIARARWPSCDRHRDRHTFCNYPTKQQTASFCLEGRHALDAMWQAMKAPAGRQAVPSAVAPATVSAVWAVLEVGSAWLCCKLASPAIKHKQHSRRPSHVASRPRRAAGGRTTGAFVMRERCSKGGCRCQSARPDKRAASARPERPPPTHTSHSRTHHTGATAAAAWRPSSPRAGARRTSRR